MREKQRRFQVSILIPKKEEKEEESQEKVVNDQQQHNHGITLHLHFACHLPFVFFSQGHFQPSRPASIHHQIILTRGIRPENEGLNEPVKMRVEGNVLKPLALRSPRMHRRGPALIQR